MAVNLITNVLDALQGFPVNSPHCCLDSTVALHCKRGNGDYKQFVGHRVPKSRDHDNATWRHVPTKDNPADYASRGGMLTVGNQLTYDFYDFIINAPKGFCRNNLQKYVISNKVERADLASRTYELAS